MKAGKPATQTGARVAPKATQMAGAQPKPRQPIFQALMQPLAIDLFCGLGGWAEGFLAEGYRVIGYDIEAHDYGTGGYPGELVLCDVRFVHGSKFKDAAVIVASPPCQAYSYRAMPWSRAKALPPPDNTLFNECFRIQREASEAAGHYIPLIVENVRGAEKWVGPARWHYGSFYLWGDVPALMPFTWKATKIPNQGLKQRHPQGISPQWRAKKYGPADHIKQAGLSGVRANGKGDKWFQDGAARHGSQSASRKASSAMIAKIPCPLAQHIARAYKPIDSGAKIALCLPRQDGSVERERAGEKDGCFDNGRRV